MKDNRHADKCDECLHEFESGEISYFGVPTTSESAAHKNVGRTLCKECLRRLEPESKRIGERH